MTPNRAKLDAAIPYILAAPQNSATIQQLCFRPEFGERTFVDELLVTTGGGVQGCRWSHTPWLKRKTGQATLASKLVFYKNEY